jgi:DNA uptake protein ComE-like DNA-binding protein
MRDQEKSHAAAVAGFHLGAISGISAILQLPVTACIIAAAEKVGGKTYEEAAKKIIATEVSTLAKQGKHTWNRTMISSVIPMIAANLAAKKYDLNPLTTTVISTIFESAISATLFRESFERFYAVNGGKVPAEVNLMKATADSFKSEIEWKEFSAARSKYIANYPAQMTAMCARNGMFSAAIFLAEPMAKTIVTDYRGKFEEAGVNVRHAETAISYGLSGGLGLLTTPFDRALNLYSSGEHTVAEVNKMLGADFKSKNIGKFFISGAARTAFCLMSTVTINEGFRFGDAVRELFSNSSVKQDIEKSFTQVLNDKEAVAVAMEAKIGEGKTDFNSAAKEVAAIIGKLKQSEIEDGLKEFGTASKSEVQASVNAARKSLAATVSDIEQKVAESEKPKATISSAKYAAAVLNKCSEQQKR